VPRLRRIEFKINQNLLPRYDPRLFAAFDDPVPESREQHLREDETYLKLGVRTVNEVRDEKGLPPVPWGDTPMVYVAGHPKQGQNPEEKPNGAKAD